MSQRTHKPQQAASADAGTATGTAKQTSTGTSAAVATLRAAEAVRGPFPVIGLGASAGGLIALRAFLEHMPASSGMAFVVIQHLSSDFESITDALLARWTAIPIETARKHFCMIPSPSLQQHEWAAHGTCGWDSPEAYFDQSARMWNALNKPDLEAIPARRLTAGAIRDAFVAANPGCPRDGIFIATTDGWFREARLCYSKDYRAMRCPRGLGASDHERLKLAPRGVVSGGVSGSESGRAQTAG